MRKYKRENSLKFAVVSVVFFSRVGLLHRSHSPRQFACLSESEKGGLSALTPHRGCASYPNRPLLAFKSGAHRLPLPILPSSCAPYYRPHPSLLSTRQLRSQEENTEGRERESPGYYLMRSRSARRMLFTVTKQTGALLCR